MSRPLTNDSVRNRKRKLDAKLQISPPKNFDFIRRLPANVVQNIFLRLPLPDLRNALNVSPVWRNLASMDYFWWQKCNQDGYLEPPPDHQVCEYDVDENKNYWEWVYMFNEALRENWQNNQCVESCPNIPFSVSFRKPNIHHFDDKIFVMTNRNNKVIVIDYQTGGFLHIFDTQGEMFCNKVFVRKTLNFLLYANDFKSSLLAWNIENGNALMHITFREKIADMVVHKNLVFLLLRNNSCVIVDITTSEIEYSLTDETVTCVCFFEDKVAFGTGYGKVIIINWESKTTVVTFIFSMSDSVRKIMVTGNFLVCFLTTRWYVCDMKTDKIVYSKSHKVDGHYDDVFLIDLTTVLMRNTREHRVEAWDFATQTCKYILHHVSLDDKIETNDRYVFLASNMVMIHCKSTGMFLKQFDIKRLCNQIFTTNTKFAYRTLHFVTVRDYEKDITEEQIDMLMC